MGLEQNSGRLIFVNIKEGKLCIKPKDSEVQFFDSISGVISKIEFKIAEYNNQQYEKAEIIIIDGDDKFLLSMRTDSGYFRGFCNSLKSGNPAGRIKISPHYKETDGKVSTTCFINQNGTTLKHFHKRDNMGDLPVLKLVTFKGQQMWDGSEQIDYWKKWLLSIKFEHELISGSTFHKNDTFAEPNDITEPVSDLPF